MYQQQGLNLWTGTESLKPSIKYKMSFKNFDKPTCIHLIVTTAKSTISLRCSRLSILILKTVCEIEWNEKEKQKSVFSNITLFNILSEGVIIFV